MKFFLIVGQQDADLVSELLLKTFPENLFQTEVACFTEAAAVPALEQDCCCIDLGYTRLADAVLWTGFGHSGCVKIARSNWPSLLVHQLVNRIIYGHIRMAMADRQHLARLSLVVEHFKVDGLLDPTVERILSCNFFSGKDAEGTPWLVPL